MQDPVAYVRDADVVVEVTKEMMIAKYLNFLQWRHENDETVLDIGCGPGQVTWEIIKPLLPPQAKLFGVDIAEEMITYAKKMYPDVDFRVLDIGTRNLPKELCNAFDHVFSSFCLHWVLDQRCAMNNIHRMLKPGGDMFCYYLGSSPVFEVFYNSSQISRWKSYITDPDKYLSAFYKKDACYMKKELNSILTDVGFKIHVCEVVEKELKFSNISELKDFLAGVHPHLARIPNHLREEFMDDNIKDLLNMKIVKEYFSSNGGIGFEMGLIVLVATKL